MNILPPSADVPNVRKLNMKLQLIAKFLVCLTGLFHLYIMQFWLKTRSPAVAEGPREYCQLKSGKMLHKYSTDCT